MQTEVDRDRQRAHAVIQPLTERVLQRVPGPRIVWAGLWSLVALVSPLVFATAIRWSGQPLGVHEFLEVLTTQGVLAYVCFVLLVGGLALADRAREVRTTMERLAREPADRQWFRAMRSTSGPVGLTVLVAAILVAAASTQYGPLPPLASLPLLFTYLIPILTFVWIYLVILIDLDRLGRTPLALDAFPHDRTLGLEDVGSLASMGLGLLLVAAVPLLVAASDEPRPLAVSLVILALSVATFVLSMWRLHRQMARAKDRYITLVRELYADAYAPVRVSQRVEQLEAQATALRAAQSLDERAHSLLTWPIGEGTVKFLVAIVSSVAISVIVRALFAVVGF